MQSDSRPILYSADLSPPTRTVWMVAKSINLELNIKRVNLFVLEQFSEEFLKINPMHTVPTLFDQGQHLWEGSAICTYLINQYGPPECSLYPKDLMVRARIDQRLYFNSSILFPPLRLGALAIFYENAAVIKPEVVEKAYEAMDIVERFLEKDDFLVGNTLTLADLTLITTVNNLQIWLPLDTDRFKRTLAWIDRVKTEFPWFDELNKAYLEVYTKQIQDKLSANKMQE